MKIISTPQANVGSRRFLSAAAPILTFGILLQLVLPSPAAHAAAYAPQALSPAVDLVLRRADMDIAEAEDPDFLATFDDDSVWEWTGDALSAEFEPVDTRRKIVQQRENLLRETACFRYDKWLIERKMNEVREKIDMETDANDASVVLPLEQVYEFLSGELDSLEHGGVDPEVREDETWAIPLFIEDDIDVSSDEKLCFYNSDYAPAGAKGYGCDAGTLRWIMGQLSQDTGAFREAVESELRAQTLVEQVIESRNAAEENFGRFLAGVDDLATGGRPKDDEFAAAPAGGSSRVHKNQAGCVDFVEPGVVLHSIRGPFAIDPDDASLALAFREFRIKADEERRAPDDLQDGEDMFAINALLNDQRRIIREFTSKRAALESATFAAGADSGPAVGNALKKLHEGVRALVKLGNSLDGGLRGFVRDFAYFLRRSCLDRPCNARLDTVLKLVFSDSCFPYGNGEYAKATGDDPQWKKCMEEAELSGENQ
ncbi:hypothetical protein HYW84_01570 [Candidatus Peregrinibacteria bacterium]|nr:hypothetical protein [Candidatus Peregrinibacteria bacterium]